MQIYVLNRARETLATTSSIYDDKHTLTLDAGSSSYEFKIDKADEASQYMDSGNYIVLQDDDDKTWLFTILDYEETQYTKTVYAEDAGIELLNKACDIWKANGPHSFEYYFNLVTSGTPWKLGVNQLAGLERTLTYEGRDTGLGRLLSILKGFDNAECTFDVAIKMNAPCDFKINVYKQVGSDRSDVQMVYSHELDDIVKKESRAEFVTALCGVGGTITPPEGQEAAEQENISFADLEYNKDGLVTTKGDKFLRAVDANKRFNPGQTTYIEAFYEYDTQSASELLNRTITRLKTYSEPQYTYTADVKVIDSTLKIGDTVTIIDHDYNPALYLSARVAKLEKSYTDPSQNTIEFCNYRLLSSRLADKLAKLQTIVNKMPSASQVGKLESNVSSLSSKTEELESQITSANGKNTNFYGKTEPANPKNGDLWYKKLENGEIEMYQYQDGTWQLLASTADLTTVQTELDQAKADMEQAKTDAQTAYDEAIKATNTANGAKAQTAEALEQAKQANDSYTALSKEVADNKASVDADYKQVSDNYTALAQEVADNKASVDADYQKAQADIAQANASYTALAQEVADNKTSVDTDIADVRKTIDKNKASADANWEQAQEDYASVSDKLTETNKTVTDIKTSVNGIKTTVADNTGKISTIRQTVDSVKTSVANAQGDIATLQTDVSGTKQTVANAQGDITSLKTSVGGVQTDITNAKKDITSIKTDISGVKTTVSNAQGDITSLRTSVGGIQADVKNAKGDITSIKTDVGGVKTTVADHTGKITQLTTDVNGVKSSVSSKVDKTTYQSYVTQTDQALSTKLTESDLNGYAKIADVKQTTDGLSASITKVQGDLNGLQIGGTNLLDGSSLKKNIGDSSGFQSNEYADSWRVLTSTSATGSRKTYSIPVELTEKQYTYSLDFKCISKTSSPPAYVQLMFRDTTDYSIYGTNGEQLISLGETRLSCTSNIPNGKTVNFLQIAISSDFVGQIALKNVKLEKGNKPTDWCMSDNDFQSQLNTLSGKITATSDRLSSVYTKSETDAKLGTKVEQSTLTQTANGLSASIASNTDKITKLTADVNGVKSTVADNTGKISTMTQTVNGVKTTVADNTGKISTMQTDVNGIKTNVRNAQGDISSLQTDVSGVKTTVADHTGKITQLTTDVNGVKSTVSSKVDKTTYQSYVTQTDRALSTKLTESDLQGYAKTVDVKQTTDGLSASITKVQGNLAYQASELIGKKSFEDGNVGDWYCAGLKTKATLVKGSAPSGLKNWIYPSVSNNLYYGDTETPVKSGDTFYVEALIPNFPGANGGAKITARSYLRCTQNGSTKWQIGPVATIASGQWGWIKGTVTVPDGVTGVIPCFSTVNDSDTEVKAYLSYASFVKLDDYTQSQLNTLSGKITATSDRLSSVYTKSEVDGKLGTKVEQSTLTQTANGLSASITKNSNILSSIGLTSDTAYINANKIALNGKTLMSNATINDAFIGNLSANKITTGTLNAANVNVINLDASKITTGTLTAVDIHQSSAGADTWINKDGIHNQIGSNNVWIKRGTLAAFDSGGQGMFMESGQLTLASSAYWQNGLNLESIDYGVIKCDDDITGKKGIGVIGKGGFNVRTDNSTLDAWTGNELWGGTEAGAGIIGTDDGKLILGSLKPTFIEGGWRFEGYDGFNHIPFVQVGGEMAKAGSSLDRNGSSIVISAWDIKLNACGKDNRNIILNRLTYNGEHTINLNDSTSDLWWGPKMHAPSFVNTSALSKKMNITKLDTQTAINAIKNTDIYDYQFKEFGETGKHYASLIIDDVNDRPQYKAAGAFVDGLGRDDGTQLGYLTVVVQNLLNRIERVEENA